MEDYRFYFKDIKANVTKNLEEDFDCKYVKFTGLSENGDVQNVITEQYVESDGVRTYVPDTPTFKSTECTLSLLFDSDDCLGESRKFADFVMGKLIDYHDTFRNLYVRLLCTKVSLDKELLYGDRKYRIVKYTFTNVKGRAYTEPI